MTHFAADMLAWRNALSSNNPDIVQAIGKEWAGWLALQRAEPRDPARPEIVVLAELSCWDDLQTHVGLAQVVALQRVRCSIVLSFPNAPMTRIAKAFARRDPWYGLVHVIDTSERQGVLESLPPDCPLIVFPQAAVLFRHALKAMFEIRHHGRMLPTRNKDGSPYRIFRSGTGFFGRAGDYSAWVADQSPEGPASTPRLPNCDPVDLGLGRHPRSSPRRNLWPRADGPADVEVSGRSGVTLAPVENGDELVVRTVRDPLPSTTVERRSARLCKPGAPLAVTLPGALLTTAPKRMRVETYRANGQVVGQDLLLHVPPTNLEPWMLSAFLNRGGGGNAVIRAFAEGVGCRLAYAEDEPELLNDVPVVWGVLRDSDRIVRQAKDRSMYFFYIDHAYFDRGHGHSYRISRNRYEAGAVRDVPADRLAALQVDVRPWKKAGSEIVVCPPTDYFIQAHGCQDWLESTLQDLRRFTDRPIIVREKPQPGKAAVPLEAALQSAHALVTHSSNVAIEAACLGTPVFVNPASAAAPVGETDISKIETPAFPDREPWLRHLAYNQFSIAEIRSGDAWRLLMELEAIDRG